MQDVTLEEIHELLGQAMAAVEIKLGDAEENDGPDVESLRELLDVILGAATISGKLTGNS